MITTILTTNFDECIKKARNESNKPHHIDEVRTPSDYNIISSSPLFPLLIFLHGDVNNYSDKNVKEEITNMGTDLVDRVVPLLKDHPLVVIGYRGWEPSIMEHLLINNIERAEGYKNGIYWCVRKGTDVDKSTDYVKTLAAKIKTNFSFVEIEGFDHLFDKVIRAHFDNEIKIEVDATTNSNDIQADKTFDLKIAKEYDSTDIDEVLLRTRIDKYCANLGISVPTKTDETLEMARSLNLIRKDKAGKSYITNAGLLLFSKPQQLIPSAKTIIRFEGSEQWLRKILGDVKLTDNYFEKTAEGNLWSQLDIIDEALASVNRPFRLKEGESKDVLPYNPRALKEVVVNSLVHRDYENAESNLVVITPSSIHLKNPGGLVEEVKVYFEDAQMSEEVKKGKRGIKGYRNPVIADLFYGSGAMDKRGSGLSDVVTLVIENSGHVDFSPNVTNTEFSVIVQSRPEGVDETTSTAQPLNVITAKFSSNIIPVLQTPNRVYFAEASISSRNELFTTYPNVVFPPFELFEKQLFTLTNLQNKNNTLRNAVETSSIDSIAIDEFLLLKEGEKRFIKLLNDSVKNHFYSLGLIVDPKKKRAYFPRTEQGEREISYQARVKRAKRTVVRPRLAANKEKVRYWEHKAFYYAVKKFGNDWGLFIEPTYVFTLDGGKVLLAPNKVGRLATKKASRDYNLSVLNDTVFWMWVLARGVRGNFALETARGENYGDNISLSTEYVSASLNYVDYIDAESDEEIVEEIDEALEDELTKLAELQREGKLSEEEDDDDENDDAEDDTTKEPE